MDMSSMLRCHLDRTLQMLERAIDECPNEAWDVSEEKVAIWQYAYHCLIGLDFWLRTPDDQFLPVAFHNDGDSQLIRSGPVMTREQIVGYRDSVYARCGALLDRMTPKELMEVVEVNGLRASLADRMLDQIRHIQHHVGSMHTQLRRKLGKAPEWVGLGT
jgi:hypothetical protein